MAVSKSKGDLINIPNIMSALIIFMLSMVLNNQWALKEWKGAKDEIDVEQNKKLILITQGAEKHDSRQQELENRLYVVEALIPNTKKTIRK